MRHQVHDGTQTSRLIEPHRLVSAGRRWYLVGYTHTDTLDRLAFWLLMLGCDFAVDLPPELGEHLRNASRANRAAPVGRANSIHRPAR